MVILGAVSADVTSKLAASAWLDDRPVHVGAGLSLRVVHNPGVAFGVGAHLPSAALLAITGLVTAGLAWASWHQAIGPPTAAGLVVGGAVANLLDRATAGTVVDIFDLGWWPTFNVADIGITMGAVVMMMAGVRRPAVTAEPGAG